MLETSYLFNIQGQMDIYLKGYAVCLLLVLENMSLVLGIYFVLDKTNPMTKEKVIFTGSEAG